MKKDPSLDTQKEVKEKEKIEDQKNSISLPPPQVYQERQKMFHKKWKTCLPKVVGFSRLRLLFFILLGICLYFSWTTSLYFLLLGAVFLIAFFWAVQKHLFYLEMMEEAKELEEIQQEWLHRYHREWKEIPLPSPPEREIPPYSEDLNLFGHSSLFHLMGLVSTPFGKKNLEEWLSIKPSIPEIQKRQKGFAELVPLLDFRQHLYLFGRRVSPFEIQPFLKWASGKPVVLKKTGLSLLVWFLGMGATFSLLLDMLGNSSFRLFWIIGVFLNILLTTLYSSTFDPIFLLLSQNTSPFGNYEKMASLVLSQSFQSSLLQDLKRELSEAPKGLERLQKLAKRNELRYSAIFYLPAQFLLLWDFHFMKKVDQWQSTYGKKMESWLRTLGKIESLASFAYLAYDEPFWCHAQFSKDKRIYRAEKIGHPLIPLQKRVYNHANLEESKPLWMITGSNMSGKTTFLRTLGINLVLALAGGPVMAKSMEISYFDLRTSITIRDSLELGHSYFMAEVYKIKEIVDLAKQASPSAPLFYLLDEMLHGTNSEDRRKAAFSILDFLGKTHSLGAVTTHDLSIATHPILKPLAEQYHFQEEYGEVLKFDYKLKKGYTTQSNALKIIEMLGIPIHDNE